MNRTAQTQKWTRSGLSIGWHHCILACVIGILIDLILPCRVAAQSVPWTEVDIGSPGAAGSLVYATGTPPTYTIKGAGVGMGNSTDSLAFVGTPACGNFEIVARVSSQQNTGSGAVAGLCVRDCQQQYAQINAVYVTPGSGLNFAYRNHNGGGLNVVNGPPTQTAPVYLRLTRTGTATGGYTDSGYYSSDGINWTLVYAHTESNTLPIPNKCYVGFIVASSVNGTLNTTVFDHVSYMTSVPQQAANLLLFLRSDVGVTYSGTAVSGWADQSGNSNNASQSTGTLQPTLSTGSVNSGILPSIAFNGSQYLTLPSGFANLTAGLSCFVVMNRATSTGIDTAFACGNSSNSDAAIVETTGTNAAMYCYKSSTSSNVTTTTTPISPGTFQILDAEFQPGSTAGTGTLYVNSVQQAQATNLVSTLNNVTRTSNYVGNDSSLSHAFNGSIAEIIVYSGITPAQRAMVMSYLLSKYALGTTPTLDAPTASPSAGVFLPQQPVVLSQDQNATVYYTVDGSAPSTASSLWFYTNVTSALNYYPTLNIHVPQTETIKAMAVAPFFNNSAVMSQTFQVDPTTNAVPRNGLAMWLMANNSVSTSGSNVATWGDVSGSGNSATNATNQPTLVSGAINGLPAVNFSGSSQFLQVPAGMSNFTSGASIFLVTKPSSVTAGARFLDFGNGATSDNIYLDEPTSTGASLFTYSGSTGSSVNSSSAITLGQYQVLEAIYNGTNTGTILTNAVQGGQSTAMSTLNNILRNNNYVAQGSASGNYFNGQIAEILMFNRAVTASEQAGIEGYLFNKYQALTSNTVAAPVISVASATLTGPTQVAIEGTTGSTIFLTRDGSTPTTSSPIYTGPVNISFSQTLKAIAVLNGVTSSVSSATYTLDSTQWPAPNSGDSTPLQLQLQLPVTGIPQDSSQH